jgi:hypothetical protein
MSYIIKSGKYYLMDWINVPVLGRQSQSTTDKQQAKVYTNREEAELEARYYDSNAEVIEID